MGPKRASSSKKRGPEKQNVRVVTRIRPFNQLEQEAKARNIVKIISRKEIEAKNKKFYFDHVFKPESDQLEVYSSVVAPMIPDVIAGFNCTVFAYGQTGSGKTYTMTGEDCKCPSNWEVDLDAGCIPRAAAHIFDALGKQASESNVIISYLELYNEEIRDLLSDTETLLSMYNDPKGTLFVQGLNEIPVESCEELCAHLQKGLLKRETAPTMMNHLSSRSHTVFTITVHIKDNAIGSEDILRTGKINLVDLAGSENIARSGCKDIRAIELANINRSLLTLGRVIHALADKTKKHVPYRDSKLTRILQDSLGGNTKTCIIATVSPAHTSHEETFSTLEYASRAQDIKNTPIANEKIPKSQLVQDLLLEIARLRKDLDAARDSTGFFISAENYYKMLKSIEVVTGEKLTFEEITKQQAKRIRQLEHLIIVRTKEFDSVCEKGLELLLLAKEVIKAKRALLRQEQYVSQVYESEANQLYEHVEQFLSTIKVLSAEISILKEKLQKQYAVNQKNQDTEIGTVSVVLSMLYEVKEEGEKLQRTGNKVEIMRKDDLNKLRLELARPLDDFKSQLKSLDTQRLKGLLIIDEMRESTNNHIDMIKADTVNMTANFATHHNNLKKLAEDNFESFFTDFKVAIHQYTYAIQKKIEVMFRNFATDNTLLNNLIRSLEEDIANQQKVGRSPDTRQAEYETRTMERCRMMKEVTVERDFEENGKQILNQMIDRAERTKLKTYAMIHHLTTTLAEDLAAIPKNCSSETLSDIIYEFDQEVNSIVNKYDVNEQKGAAMRKSLGADITKMSNVLDSKLHPIGCQVDKLLDNRRTFDAMFKIFARNGIHLLKEELLGKYVPVVHEGNTPRGGSPDIFTTESLESIVPREVLIEQYNQMRTSDDEGSITEFEFELDNPDLFRLVLDEDPGTSSLSSLDGSEQNLVDDLYNPEERDPSS